MSKIDNNVSFKGISVRQTALRNTLCNRDLCRSTIKQFPDASFNRIFQAALQDCQNDSEPVFIFENPFYLCMLEKFNAIRPRRYCKEWLQRHVELKYGEILSKDPINYFCIDGKDKKDFIRFFRRLDEREYITPFGEELEKKANGFFQQTFKTDKLEDSIMTLLDKNDSYQDKFCRFLAPKGIKIKSPYQCENQQTFYQALVEILIGPQNQRLR